jgi:hypothetical protein
MMPRIRRIPRHLSVTVVLAVPVLWLLAALIRRAWLDIDTAWDSLAYHLPFAALRIGIISPAQYHLSHGIATYYAGFPVIPDYIQGLLWRVTARPQAANLAALFALLVLVGCLWLIYRIPGTDAVIAFLAIPVVLIDSTSAYVDLLTNCVMTILLLFIFRALVFPSRFRMRDLLGAAAAFAVVTNCKLPFVPIGTVAFIALAGILYVNRKQLVQLFYDFSSYSRLLQAAYLTLILVALGLAYYKSFQNWRYFGNPLYPVAVHYGPLQLPGLLDSGGTTPAYLRQAPKALVWVLSVLEYNAFDGRIPFWTNGQGDLKWTSPAFRMGGYFGAFVLLNAFWFAFLQFRVRRKFGWKPALFMGAITAGTAILPAAHELRYYSYWMLSAVAVNLILLMHGLHGDERFNARLFYLAGAASCLAFVLSSSGAVYIRKTGAEPDRLVEGLGITKRLSDMNLRQSEAVCVIGKDPLTFLYAPFFNHDLASRTHYTVLEAYTLEDCNGKRVVP